MRINGHGHILPEPNEIPQFLKDRKLFSIDDDKKFMRQGDWTRPITDPSFFLREKLEWMERYKIDHAVMLNLSQIYCNGWERQETYDTIRWQNDFNAKIQREHPDKFTCGFVVQPLHLEDALKEIERSVEELNLSVLCLPTHFLNAEGEWLTVMDESVFPIFELANHYKLAIEIHPYDGEKMVKLKDEYWRFHLVWMMAQTADALHFFSLKDFVSRFPDIRTCFAHGCMLGQANYGRRLQGYDGRPDLFQGAKDPRNTLGHPNVFFDTLVHDSYTLQLLKIRVGATQIVAGLDDPYPLGEMEGVARSYPGRVIDFAVEAGILTEKESKEIWYDNVLRWLGKSGIEPAK
ncbi:amidohydrolase family protein [Crocinitomicaceae bacterium CZZ-1]|uniref:Amidohydrolase family protein n=1 Tax=Taishania pollutisoli TaxID=2766479 RepID=A0A8J6P6Z6_9FLAO|nr:amidohydrolase family protein [Taishania pollutisoli]MBC9812992.1 amidohydrolase family protein [Taishania pollutisoli]MBX2948726.1 amidohydrolase family protein [Crocinitomicaceae bacterium]NGF75695.1 amidohydrolase family protein [Fluviicola sp. SGL-29]